MTSQAAGMYSQQAVRLRRQAVPTSQQEEMHMSTRSQTVIPSQQAEMTVTSLDRPEKHVYTYQEMMKANL